MVAGTAQESEPEQSSAGVTVPQPGVIFKDVYGRRKLTYKFSNQVFLLQAIGHCNSFCRQEAVSLLWSESGCQLLRET